MGRVELNHWSPKMGHNYGRVSRAAIPICHRVEGGRKKNNSAQKRLWIACGDTDIPTMAAILQVFLSHIHFRIMFYQASTRRIPEYGWIQERVKTGSHRRQRKTNPNKSSKLLQESPKKGEVAHRQRRNKMQSIFSRRRSFESLVREKLEEAGGPAVLARRRWPQGHRENQSYGSVSFGAGRKAQ